MIFDYIGKVRILKQDSNGNIVEKTLNNSGTDNLFKFFINCLLGNFDKSAVPSYIDLRYERFDADTNVARVSSATVNAGCPIVSSAINEVEIDGETFTSAQFVANFSAYDFIGLPEDLGEIILDSSISEVYLTIVGDNKQIELTRLQLSNKDFEDITSLSDDQKVAIEWTMLVKNHSDGGNV